MAAAKVSASSKRMMMLLTFQSPNARATTATPAAVALAAVPATPARVAATLRGALRRAVASSTAMRGSSPRSLLLRIGRFAEGLRKGCTVSANRPIRRQPPKDEALGVTASDGLEAPRPAAPSRRRWSRYARPGVVLVVTAISLYVLLPSLT